MTSQLGFSEIEFNKESDLENKPRRRRNKTIKKKEHKTEKVKQFLNSLEDMNASNDNTLESMDNANLEDFSADFNFDELVMCIYTVPRSAFTVKNPFKDDPKYFSIVFSKPPQV